MCLIRSDITIMRASVHVKCTCTVYQFAVKSPNTVGAWFSYQLQPPVATAPLHSPSGKQHSIKPVILACIARAERSTTHVDMYLQKLLPGDFSRQKFDLAPMIQRCHLRSLCTAAASSK